MKDVYFRRVNVNGLDNVNVVDRPIVNIDADALNAVTVNESRRDCRSVIVPFD